MARKIEPYYVGDLITHADDWWRSCATKAVREMIGRGVDFTQEDIGELAGEPSDGNHWGALFQSLARRDQIEPVGFRRSSKKSRKGGIIRVWRAVPAARDAYLASITQPDQKENPAC